MVVKQGKISNSGRPLRTAELASAVGIHPNTVRLYEEWGFISPAPRAANGYRLFTPMHLEQLRLARLALHGEWPGRLIRRSALALVRQAAGKDFGGALDLALLHREIVAEEYGRAEEAIRIVENWSRQQAPPDNLSPARIHEAAKLAAVTIDMIRNWERNHLVNPVRHAGNRYRLYAPADIDRLRIIRILREAGYSTLAIMRMLRQLDSGRLDRLREALTVPPPDDDIIYATDHWLAILEEQRSRAEQIITLLQHMQSLPNNDLALHAGVE
jgi:DNA-binding transcriptional MerR regulator